MPVPGFDSVRAIDDEAAKAVDVPLADEPIGIGEAARSAAHEGRIDWQAAWVSISARGGS